MGLLTLQFTLRSLCCQVHSVSASQLLKAKGQSLGCFAKARPVDTKGGCGLWPLPIPQAADTFASQCTQQSCTVRGQCIQGRSWKAAGAEGSSSLLGIVNSPSKMLVFQIPELPLTSFPGLHFVTNFTLRSFTQTSQSSWNSEVPQRKKYLPFNNPVIHKNYSRNWALSISPKFSWWHWEVMAPISRRGLKLQDKKLISQSLKPTWDLTGRSLYHQLLRLETNAEQLHIISGTMQYLTGYLERNMTLLWFSQWKLLWNTCMFKYLDISFWFTGFDKH